MPRPLRLFRFPRTDYPTVWAWQTATAEEVRGGGPEALALLEHPPTFTFGRRVRREHLLVSEESLRARGAELVESDRGGDITFHGPGQIVGYPILDLRRHDLRPTDYVRRLEQMLSYTLGRFGISAGRVVGRPGVWVGDAKIGAIGVRVRNGITTHGFSLNVNVDLSWYDAIVPCGIADATVTSMEHELGRAPSIDSVEFALTDVFAAQFDVEPILVNPRRTRPRPQMVVLGGR